MKKMTGFHGDVSWEAVDSIPKEAVKLKVFDGFVVEKGEGVHTHTIRRATPCTKSNESPLQLKSVSEDFEIYSVNDTMFLKVKKGTVTDHEEHGSQVMRVGIHKKNIERQYDYEANEERRVID